MNRNLTLLLLAVLLKTATIAQPTASGSVWLVAVGIGAYQHDDILTRLDFTIQGAYEFTRIFEGRQLSGGTAPVLTNQKARRTDIIRALENTFVNNPEVQPDDIILFYFSGHGEIAGGKAGICPYDFSGDVRDLITDEEIQRILQQSPARYKACFIEACKTEAQSALIFDPSILENLNQKRRGLGGGLVYMTSTKAGEKSWGKPDIGGYFTHFLLRGLEGEANSNDDAYITVDELFAFVQRGVKTFSLDKQIPQINDRKGYDAAMPLMVIPEKLPPAPTKPVQSNIPEYSERHFINLLKNFAFNAATDASTEEAKRLVQAVGGTNISVANTAVTGTLEGGWEITCWAGSYDKADTYGVRYGKPEDNYWRNNDTYFEVFKPAVSKGLPLSNSTETYPLGFEYLAIDMVTIPSGEYQMGDNFKEGNAYEKPVHTVKIKAFSLSRYEVTQAQWKAVMGENPSNFKDCNNCPVERVSWDDVQLYLKKLNEKTGKNFRLPSEAEWEYAARQGGKTVRFGNGKDIADPREMNFDASESNKKPYSVAGEFRVKTVPVSSFTHNSLGLYNMSGNVWEWCQDTWHDSYDGAPTDGSAWASGGDAARRVVRGGSWGSNPEYCRAAYRYRYSASSRSLNIGFRLAR
ncbi:MAG: SUMF1/EgtB/PvdO family nonheme iron enzyme [Saprospiraceae bacterium]|nr:SUMF1/EgtB/PvdO family nonheme iron enzyme [Saprospiraceae bacterium]